MKKLSLLICCGLLFNACAPQDREVVSKEQRDQLQQRQNDRNSPKGFRFGSFGLSAFLTEKQGEALQIVMTSQLAPGQGIGKFNNKENITRNPDAGATVQSDEKILDQGKYKSLQKSSWIFSKYENNKMMASLEKSSFELESLKNQSEKVSFNEAPALLMVEEFDTTTQITYLSSGELSIRASGTELLIPFKLKIGMTIEKFSPASAEIKILKSSIEMDYTLKDPLKVVVSSENSLIFKNDACPRMIGKISINDGRNPVEMIFDEKAASVAKPKHSTAHAECSKRPVADLSRILIY